MALVTHPLKGSCSTFPSVSSLCSRGSSLKHFVPARNAFGRKDRFFSLKCRSCSRIGASFVLRPKLKSIKISTFKGSNQYDDSGGRVSSAKSLKNAGKVSYLQHKSEDSSVESSKVQNIVPASHTEAVDAATSSMAIQNLFKNWLMVLHTPSQTHTVEEVNQEPSSTKTSEMPHPSEKRSVEIQKAVWCYMLGLDATIKLPILLFTPLYLAVNLIYGSKVSKELTPLWILGPLILSFNIKMFQAICRLYAFGFKKMIKAVKNLPVYYSLARANVVHGKTFMFQPLSDMKNMNYNEVTRRIMMNMQGWLLDRYLDFLELIWPFYRGTIRFLKKSNLI